VEGLKNCKDFHAGKNKYFLTELSKIILSKKFCWQHIFQKIFCKDFP
jgi:hypothetical protein